MPLLVTVTTAVTWRGVGDLSGVSDLLTDITAIGKKRAHGQGRVLHWQVTPLDDVQAWEASHLHPDGTLGRTTPPACLTGHGVLHAGVGAAGLRPPYAHPSRQHHLARPLAVTDLV